MFSFSHYPQQVLLMLCLLLILPSCQQRHNADKLSPQDQSDIIEVDTIQTEENDGVSFLELLGVYDTTAVQDNRITLFNNIFSYLMEEDILEEPVVVDSNMPSDSIDMLLYYWSAEFLYKERQLVEGLLYAQRALSMSGNYDNKMFVSDCESLLASIYFSKSDYVNAIEHARQALLIERDLDDAARLSSALNNLAAISLASRHLDEARVYILEALHYSSLSKDSARMASQNGIASEVFNALGRYDEAVNYARQALVLDSLTHNDVKKGVHLSQLATAQISLGRLEDAKKTLDKAIPLLMSIGNYYSLSICWLQMGEILNTTGDYVEAKEYFSKALKVFTQMGNIYLEIRARRGLSEALKTNDPFEALEQMEILMVLRDSINSDEMRQTISKYNAMFNNEQYAKQIELDDVRHRAEMTIAISAVLGLIMIIMFLLVYIRVRKRNHMVVERLSLMRESFYTNITHEFRTPLTIILGVSGDIQKEDNVPMSIKRKMQMVERQGNGLLTLVNQLLDISKIKSAVGNPDWRNGNITTYIEMIVDSYRDHANRSNIDLLFYAKDVVKMDFVPDYVSKIMNNLLSNALKFTPEYGKVSVASWKDDDYLVVDVTDTGIGMNQDTIKHVFEPFYRSETDNYVIGTGVGLSLVKQIVDAVEGTIVVDSAVGRGTTFRVSLPLRSEIDKQFDGAITNNPMLSEHNIANDDVAESSHEYRLLVVEDNRDIASYLGSHFEERFDVAYAANGKDGLDKALKYVPDLIITDLMMPVMDGIEMCHSIKNNDIVSHIPIVMITAKDSDADRIRCIEAGVDANLPKPFNSEELRALVDTLLEKSIAMRQKLSVLHKESVDTPSPEVPQSPEENTQGVTMTQQQQEFLQLLSDVVKATAEHGYVDVNTIASGVKMTPNQLRRKLFAITGDTTLAFIKSVQMMKAKQLLTDDPDLPIGDVAFRCGYSLQTHFSRAFKAYCGMTPMQWRKNGNQNVGLIEKSDDVNE